jgi:hypothetical protein
MSVRLLCEPLRPAVSWAEVGVDQRASAERRNGRLQVDLAQAFRTVIVALASPGTVSADRSLLVGGGIKGMGRMHSLVS